MPHSVDAVHPAPGGEVPVDASRRVVLQADSLPTLEEVRRWPATVDVSRAAAAFGISRSLAYDLVRRGAFPAKVLTVGSRHRVVTASILLALEPDAEVA